MPPKKNRLLKNAIKQKLGFEISDSFTANEAKAKQKAFEELFGTKITESKPRDAMNRIREAKEQALNGKADTLRLNLPSRMEDIKVKAQQAIRPLYAFDDGEDASNWCIKEAGIDLGKLDASVAVMKHALTKSVALEQAEVIVKAFHAQPLQHVKAFIDAYVVFSQTPSTLPLTKIIEASNEGKLIAAVANALTAMSTRGLTTETEFADVLKLLTQKVSKPTTEDKTRKGTMNLTEVEGLLALEPKPNKINTDLRKRQNDPAKLKTLLGKVRLEHTEPTLGIGGVDRAKIKTLAAQDPRLETQGLLEIGVPPALLVEVTALNEFKPKRLADITKDEVEANDLTCCQGVDQLCQTSLQGHPHDD